MNVFVEWERIARRSCPPAPEAINREPDKENNEDECYRKDSDDKQGGGDMNK
jgi:hypothetical protein